MSNVFILPFMIYAQKEIECTVVNRMVEVKPHSVVCSWDTHLFDFKVLHIDI